ncbi:MAG: hypothetical protein F4Y88_00080 [Chloroflexi bacterium]|nr:hypothetical protein [Chloroflexota bacterium]
MTQDHIHLSTGHEVGRMAYGTGPVPFVRTSDIANWEIKVDPKQAVSTDVYARYSSRQDVAANDLLLVRDGTYLIGTLGLVTDDDLPMLYQSHIVRLRALPRSPLSPHLLLVLMQSPIYQGQLRARQFTADIIDSLGDRYLDAVLPVPQSVAERERLEDGVRAIVEERSRLRTKLKSIAAFPSGRHPSEDQNVNDAYRLRRLGFQVEGSMLTNRDLIPKRYNPALDSTISSLSKDYEFVSLGNLVNSGAIEWSTGFEVGKMAYGTGPIPFIRSSDLTNWELKRDPKHSVSEDIWSSTNAKADVEAYDVLLVRDGTYLVGESAMVMPGDVPLLFAGGLYRFRVIDESQCSPFLLLAMFQTDIVRQQIRSRQFTRDIIDTVGKRIFDVLLPFPRDKAIAKEIARETRVAIERRDALRGMVNDLAGSVHPP